jgi:ketosteroid isomerase-like protein
MSAENLESARQALETYVKTGRLDLSRLDDDAPIRDHDIPDPGDYRGPRGFVQWLKDWNEAWEAWSMVPEEYIDAGDKIVMVFQIKARGRASGLEVDRHDALVYEYRGDRIVAVDYYNSREQAAAAAGLTKSA